MFQILFVVRDVFETKTLKSTIALLPNKMTNYEGDVVNKPFYTKMIKWVAQYTSDIDPNDIEIYSVSQDGLSAQEFEDYKRKIFKYDPTKNKFYFGTFPFASTGQNFVCEFDENQIKDFIKINDYGKCEKDIDSIFICKPTNLYPIDNDQSTIMTKLYLTESLYFRKQIDLSTYEKNIKAAINKEKNT